ncbi:MULTISPECIES: sensor histidine kinase [unclassified Ligilactobacillus]|uniref:sensor histidine kinase n=1 Tax=unclassified Ligilactobacillus TaxID=2767920 RepID=UPI0038533705
MERITKVMRWVIAALFPIIIGYGVVLGILIVLTELVPGTHQIVLLFFQFSWPMVVVWGAGRLIRFFQVRSRLRQHDYAFTASFRDQLYLHELKRLGREKRNLELEISKLTDQRHEYLELWAHELKTPLTALKLEALQCPPRQRQRLTTQLTAVNHQVEMLLAAERLRLIHNDLGFTVVNLRRSIAGTIRRLEPVFTGKNIAVTLDVSPTITVLTDPTWWTFVVRQLLLNAVQYSLPGRTIMISVHDQTVLISDQGYGIPVTDQPQIFKEGFTGHNGRIHNPNATGMGLYLVRQVCTVLGIKVTVSSVIDQGTTFHLTFTPNKLKNNKL